MNYKSIVVCSENTNTATNIVNCLEPNWESQVNAITRITDGNITKLQELHNQQMMPDSQPHMVIFHSCQNNQLSFDTNKDMFDNLFNSANNMKLTTIIVCNNWNNLPVLMHPNLIILADGDNIKKFSKNWYYTDLLDECNINLMDVGKQIKSRILVCEYNNIQWMSQYQLANNENVIARIYNKPAYQHVGKTIAIVGASCTGKTTTSKEFMQKITPYVDQTIVVCDVGLQHEWVSHVYPVNLIMHKVRIKM